MTIVAHAEPLDIDIYARPTYYFSYKNERFNTLIAEVAATADEAARNAKYQEAQALLAEDVPALFLFQLPKLGVWDARLKGLWQNTPIPSNDVTKAYWAE
jgi:peptide/nickel transport system substrate-binding protein